MVHVPPRVQTNPHKDPGGASQASFEEEEEEEEAASPLCFAAAAAAPPAFCCSPGPHTGWAAASLTETNRDQDREGPGQALRAHTWGR